MIKLLLIILLSTIFTASSFPIFRLQAGNKQPLELIERKTKALVEGPFAEIQYIETYKNPYNHPVEARFLFHRSEDYFLSPEDSFLSKFEAIIANETITWEVQPNLPKTYVWSTERTNQTKRSSHDAKITSKLIDIYLGSLLPNQTVQIALSVAQPLPMYLFQVYELKLPARAYQKKSLKEWNVEVEIRYNQPFVILSNPSHGRKPGISHVTPNLYLAFYIATITPDKDFIVYFAPEKLQKLQLFSTTHASNKYFFSILAIPDAKHLSPKVLPDLLENPPQNFEKGNLITFPISFVNWKIGCYDHQKQWVYGLKSSGGQDLKDYPLIQEFSQDDIANFKSCELRVFFHGTVRVGLESFLLDSERDVWSEEKITINVDENAQIIPDLFQRIASDMQIKWLEEIDERTRDRDFKKKKEREQKIINLSLQYQIPSERTPFVAVVQNGSQKEQVYSERIDLQPFLFSSVFKSKKRLSHCIPDKYISQIEILYENMQNYIDGPLFGEKKWDFEKRKFWKKLKTLQKYLSRDPLTKLRFLSMLPSTLLFIRSLYHFFKRLPVM